jgi:hypothetical protein
LWTNDGHALNHKKSDPETPKWGPASLGFALLF